MFFRDIDQDTSRALGIVLAVADDKWVTLSSRGRWGNPIHQSFVSRDHASIQRWLAEQIERNRRIGVLLNYTRRLMDFHEPYPYDFESTSWLALRIMNPSREVMDDLTEWSKPYFTAIVRASDSVCCAWKTQRTLQMHQAKEFSSRMLDQIGRGAVPECYLDVPFSGGAKLLRYDPGCMHEVAAFKPTKEENAIEREYEKALTHTVPGSRPPALSAGEHRPAISDGEISFDDDLEFESMENVTAKPIEWLWEQKFAIGKLNLLGGMPGQGKSQVTISLAAAVSRGGLLPDGRRAPAGKVLLLVSEDDAGDTIKPRLEAAGADMRNVFIVRANFSIGADFAKFKALIEKIGDVRLVVFDPVVRYVDAGANQTVRKSLDRVIDWAQSKRICLLGILHPPKGEKITNVQSLFGGSSAFVQLCRGAWMCLPSGEDGLFYFLFAKGNIYSEEGKRDGKSYHIEGFTTPNGIKTSRVVWTQDHIDMTADDALSLGIGQNSARKEQPKPKPESNRYADNFSPQEVAEWLRDRIARGGGSVELATLRSEAEAMGISPPRLYRAKDALRVREDDTDDRLNNGKVWALRH